MKGLTFRIPYKPGLSCHSFLVLFLAGTILTACKSDPEQPAGALSATSDIQNTFDSSKWAIRQGKDYPYRKSMLSTLVHTDTLRMLNRTELLRVLGTPDRDSEGHLYYLIDQNRLGPWPLNSRFMVIKMIPEDSVEWIKIHE